MKFHAFYGTRKLLSCSIELSCRSDSGPFESSAASKSSLIFLAYLPYFEKNNKQKDAYEIALLSV
jgi:hypothetical protein